MDSSAEESLYAARGSQGFLSIFFFTLNEDFSVNKFYCRLLDLAQIVTYIAFSKYLKIKSVLQR